MRSKKYIPGFTMMDILTGMVVMSIVIVMVFYLMSATNQQAFSYQKVRIELNNYILLKADLKRQTDLADRIEDLPNGFKLISSEGEIEYQQQDNFLLRKTENSVDTLSDDLLELKKTTLETATMAVGPKILSGIELKLNLETQVLKCYLYKDYGLTEPINQKLIREF